MSRSAVTEADVAHAIDVEIRTWRENLKFALQDARLPRIGDNPFLKSCAWLSVAKDPIRVFAPKSVAGRIITWLISDAVKLAPPMFIMSQAAAAFDAAYEATLQDHNRLLNSRYETIKDIYFNKIDNQARVFRSTGYGRRIIRDVTNYLRGQTFDDIDKAAYLLLLLHRSRFIETERQTLRTQAAEGFSRICETLYRIYLGSHRGPGFNNELRIRTGVQSMTAHRIGSPMTVEESVLVRDHREQDRILARAWMYTAEHTNQPWYVAGSPPDTTYLRPRSGQGPLRIPHSWTGPPLPLREGDRAARAAFAAETGRMLQ